MGGGGRASGFVEVLQSVLELSQLLVFDVTLFQGVAQDELAVGLAYHHLSANFRRGRFTFLGGLDHLREAA